MQEKVEEVFGESEERFRAIVNQTLAGIAQTDLSGQFVLINDRFCEIVGYTREELLSLRMQDITHPDDLPQNVELFKRCVSKGIPFDIEKNYVRKDGQPVPVHNSVSLIRDADGNAQYILAVVVDLTERNRSQEALEESEERYRAFVTQSNEAIWRFELKEPISIGLPADEQIKEFYLNAYLAECNDSTAKMYGASSAKEIIGLPLKEFLPPDDKNNIEYLRAFIASGYRLSDAESHEVDRDGKAKYFLNNLTGIVEDGYVLRAWGTQRDITDKKLTVEATAHLASIVESSDDAIISKNLNSIILSWNRGAEKIFGYTAEEVIGKPITILMPPNRTDEEPFILSRIRSGEKVQHYETIRRRKDGTEINISLTVSPIRDNTGKIIGASKIARDITARKKVEEELVESRMMLSMAMQSSRMGAWEHDIATETVNWSVELEEIFGLKKGSFEGTQAAFYELIYEEDRQLVSAEVKKAIEEQREYAVEFRFHHADGSLRWMEGRGQAVYTVGGQPVRIYGIGIDITGRKKIEEKLLQNERQLRLVTDSIPALISYLTADRRYAFVNRAYEDWFEHKTEELVGRHMSEVLGKEAYQLILPYIEKVLSGEEVNFERLLPYKDGGERFVQVNYVPDFDTDGHVKGFYALVVDMTERKRAERDLQFQAHLLDTVGQAVIATDIEGRIIYWNKFAEQLYGWKSEEILNHNIVEITPAASSRRMAKEIITQLNEGKSWSGEFQLKRRGGSDFLGLVTNTPIFDDEGNLSGIVGISFDITEQRRIENAVRESEERYRSLFESIDEGFSVVEMIFDENNNPVDYRFLEVNPMFEKQSGLVNATGRTALELVPNLEKRWFEIYGRVAVTGESTRFVEGSDAMNRWFDVYAFRVGGNESRKVAILFTDITERRAGEERLRESQAHLQMTTEAAQVGTWQWHIRENRIVWSPIHKKMWGFEPSPEPIKYEDWVSLLVAEDLKQVEKGIEKSLKTGKIYDVEYRIRPAGRNETRWIRSNGTVEFDESGEPLRMQGISLDITDRKRNELNAQFLADIGEDLSRLTDPDEIMQSVGKKISRFFDVSRVFFTEIDESASEAIVFYDWCKKELSSTVGVYALSDFLSEEVLEDLRSGKTVAVNDVWKDKRTAHSAELYQQLEIGSHIHAPYLSDGRWKFILAAQHRQPYDWRKDEIELMSELASRIWTRIERTRAQEALLKAERRAAEEYQALLARIVPLAQTLGTARDLLSVYRAVCDFVRHSMPCSAFFVSFFDAQTNLRLAAYAWGESTGEVDISKLPPIQLTEDGGPNSQAIFQKKSVVVNRYMDLMKSRPHVILEEDGVNPNSSLVVPMIVMNRTVGTLEVQAYQNEAFEHEHIVALEMVANLAAVAIENVRLLEVEAKARQEAEAANRSKDEFLSVLSHELRTPLNSMLGWTRMLRGGVLDEAKSKQAIETIERNARLQHNLIEDLLDVSRIISGKMRIEAEEVDFVTVVINAVETVRPLAQVKNISLEFQSEMDSLIINGDAARLHQIVVNLANNAVKFTPEGGAVTLGLSQNGNRARLEVADNGIGISAEFLPQIFDRFRQADSTTKRHHSGLGLGLTIVHHLTELHGGTIEVKSDGAGKGATFTVELPLAVKPPRAPDLIETAAGINGSVGKFLVGKRILLVDDDFDGLVPLQLVLERHGAEAVCVSSATEALDEINQKQFDLLISDIGMPEIDGYSLINKVREINKEKPLPAIALTAYAGTDDRERTLSSGYQYHLAKPVDFELLLETVKNLLNHSENNE